MDELSLWVAFAAGVLSFISPCCLPLYPSYLSYITGVSVAQLTDQDRSQALKRNLLIHTIFFMIGFSIIFYSLAFALSFVGDFFKTYQDLIRMLGAILIFAMGLVMLGVFQPKFMMKERRLNIKTKGVGYLSSTLVGVIFSAGWTPCMGPIVILIVGLAATNPEMAFIYMTAYILGFAIPFIVMAFFIGRTKWILRYSNTIMKIGGGIMLILALLLYFDQMTAIIVWMQKVTGFSGF
ncbi:cytochrome c biogenesis protein CcdA [Hazenella sp. IB182357]|uniref:Cytochrome c biogenesis protein CcdA n=1 Tax=Polycladospora coralii TaxID=2771432 RepID=A0A926RT63_9BACL|nr:cytochrome c biogenesis protein CcdA [Polycladospora coralii]MBD1371293.1 cytochrome c biogenesis protein CcdA [Polycladospora coralii]MBS7530254.1 cytochrome c biogenesis protein CcdA [Polycladospora coralii]